MMSKYELESLENEIIAQLDKGGEVIIERGAANDSILCGSTLNNHFTAFI